MKTYNAKKYIDCLLAVCTPTARMCDYHRISHNFFSLKGCFSGGHIPDDEEELLTPEMGRQIMEREQMERYFADSNILKNPEYLFIASKMYIIRTVIKQSYKNIAHQARHKYVCT